MSEPDRLLTAEEVAEMFGFKSVETIYRWGVAGILPRVVLSTRAVRFREADVQAFVASRVEAS